MKRSNKKVISIPYSLIFYGMTLVLLLIVSVYNEIMYNKVNIINIQNLESLNVLQKIVLDKLKQNSDLNVKSLHVWYDELPNEGKNNIDLLAEEIQSSLSRKYEGVSFLKNMTEINASGTQHSNSDTIYFTRHYDAPFGITSCKVLRVLVAVNGTPDTSTVFKNQSINLKTGMAVVFDYDRSAHYITVNPNEARSSDDTPRITAKLQFIVHSSSESWCAKMHEKWSIYSRELLLQDQNKIRLTTYIGILATYISTYMHIVIILALFFLSIYLYHNNSWSLILFGTLYTFIVSYYIFVFYILTKFTYRT